MSSFTSRNSRAPNDYKRRFTISWHALDRFRGRVDDEFRYRDDTDLKNLLDEKLCHAEQTWDLRDPRAPSEVTHLMAISTRKAGRFYAVVRNETAVTILDEAMAANNFAGQWQPILSLPFSGLKDFNLTPPIVEPLHAPSHAAPVLVPMAPPVPEPMTEPSAKDAFIAAWRRKRAAERALDTAEHELDVADAAYDEAAQVLVAENERAP